MRVNFSVTNQLATPSIHAAALANRPPAGQPGRLFVDTDNPSSGIYRDTGTVWENITGGAGAGNLQTVTDAGNTTDNNILLTYADNTIANALVFYNDALTQEEYLIEKRGTGITTNDSLAIQSRGNISPSTNPVGFLIDGANDIVKSFYTTSYSEVGLKLDFVNQSYDIGNPASTLFRVNDSNGRLQSKYNGDDIGISFDLQNGEYYIGDFDGISNGVFLLVDNTNQLVKTATINGDIGLKLDFANDEYKFGNFFDTNKSYFFIDNAGNAYVKSEDGVSNLTIQSADLGGNDRVAQLLIQNSLLSTSLTLNTDPSSNLNQIYSQGTGEFKISNTTSDSNLILQVAGGNSSIKTNYQNNDVGLKLDFANLEYYLGGVSDQYNVKVSETTGVDIGDIFGAANGNQINLTNDIIKTQHSSNDIGLKLDFATNSYSLGDYNSGVTGTSIIVDDANQFIKTSWQAADIGLKLDYVSSVYYLGDFNNIQDLIYCKADIGNGFFDIVSAQYVNFRAEGANVQIGDIDNFDNGTRFGVDDLNQKLTATTNLLVGSSGSSSGQHLKIKVGTTDYVIELKNP